MTLSKIIAVPAKFLDTATLQIREDLTAEEIAEMAAYGVQALTADEMVEFQQAQEGSEEIERRNLMSAFEKSIQSQLDEKAIVHGYDNINTAVSYAEEPAVEKFYLEGRAFRAWRSLVWAYAYEQLAAVLAGERAQPDVESFLLELPALQLPQ